MQRSAGRRQVVQPATTRLSGTRYAFDGPLAAYLCAVTEAVAAQRPGG